MIWRAYELLAYINNLTMTDSPVGSIEWIGSQRAWNQVEKDIDYHENNL